jgi:hypothetical protein
MSIDRATEPAGGVSCTVAMTVAGSDTAVSVDLRWLAADPFAVTLAVHTGNSVTEWSVDRELICAGLERPVGERQGDIRVRPQLFAPFVEITLAPPKQTAATLVCPTALLRGFLAETLVCLPLDAPITVPDPAWFTGGARP